MDKELNAQIRQLCEVTNGVDEKIDEGVLRCFGNVEKMENNRIAKRVYVGECVGTLFTRLRKEEGMEEEE